MCPDDERIVLLIEGKLDEVERSELEAHLDACEVCRRLIGFAIAHPSHHAPASSVAAGDATASSTAPDDATLGSPRGAEKAVLGRGASVGRYLVLSLRGRGAMGEVYAAYDPELDRRVALKLLRTARGSEADRRRLVREARALGKLSHPNVVQVHDVGEHAGQVFVAMELVDGESLETWCRSDPKPSVQTVLAAYLDAARGLSAAHAKGLVHRDVKPSNILRGKDARVRVVDFGLVGPSRGGGFERVSEAPENAREGESTHVAATTTVAESGSPLDARLTATGALMGTPSYMAPEQHERANVGPASDQFSLCVALYEALYGAPPFKVTKGSSLDEIMPELLDLKRRGVGGAMLPARSVPAWVHRALVRGLAPKPEDRHPSMDALVAALERDPDTQRRARWRTVGIVAAACAFVAALGWAGSGALRNPCASPERELAGAWDDGVKDRIRAAFLGTGRSYAEGTVARVVASLDDYGASWAKMRGEVCEASRHGKQEREILVLRDVCLDRRRAQLQALTTLFAEKSDPVILDRAVQATAGLSPVAYCADTEALTARVRPPEDPAMRARVAALQPRVDRLETLYRAGKYKEGVALGEPLLAETSGFAYAPLRAQVEYWTGRLEGEAGDYEKAKTLLRQGAISAAEGRDDALAAHAWAMLLLVVGDRQFHMDEAAVILALGPAAVARAHDERLEGHWLNSAGTVLAHMHKYPEAIAAGERAAVLMEKTAGPDHIDVGRLLGNLATTLMYAGDPRRAEEVEKRANAIFEKSLGGNHPELGRQAYNLGLILTDTGEYAQAVASYERAIAIREAMPGPDMIMASALTNMGWVLDDMGEYPRARAAHERALALKKQVLGPDHPHMASALAGLGRVEVHLGHLDAAEPPLQDAREILERAKTGDLGEPLLGLGELALARNEPADAVRLLERALALEFTESKQNIRFALADALWRVGKDRARARALVEEARVGYERVGHRRGLDRAAAWLAAHGLDGAGR